MRKVLLGMTYRAEQEEGKVVGRGQEKEWAGDVVPQLGTGERKSHW